MISTRALGATLCQLGAMLCVIAGCEDQPGKTVEIVPELQAVEGVGILNLKQAGSIWIGGHGTVQGLAKLKDRGLKTVIDLRLPEQTRVTTAEEIANLGLAYIPLPMRSDSLTEEQADAFIKAMGTQKGRDVFLFCRTANRSGAMYGLYLGRALGWSTERAVARSREAGMTRDELAGDLRRHLEKHHQH